MTPASLRRTPALVVIAALASACSQLPPPPDTVYPDAAGIDVTRPDVVARDTVRHDGSDSAIGGDSSVGVDVTMGNPCESVIDLAREGSADGATTRYTGSNASAPQVGSLPGACVFDIASEAVFSYTMQTDGFLRVSTANPGTPAAFDTVVWAVDRCSTANTSLGCSDDSAPGDRRAAFTTDAVILAGTTVYLVVAGYSPPRANYHAVDMFELSVTEIEEIPSNGPCDPTGAANVCEPHSHCLGDASSARCVRDGTRGGRCNAAPPGCELGLGCNGDRLAPSTRCVPEVQRGASCDLMMQTNMCVVGTTCTDLGSGPICL